MGVEGCLVKAFTDYHLWPLHIQASMQVTLGCVVEAWVLDAHCLRIRYLCHGTSGGKQAGSVPVQLYYVVLCREACLVFLSLILECNSIGLYDFGD